jgi:heat shock protein beta
MSFAITEDDSEISLRDANSSRERPKLDGYDMDDATQATVESQKENFNFNADVSRLMDIIINSLYTKKEVFIRELISNASDALDKARFMSVADVEFLSSNPELEIKIDYDFEAKTISITDTGIGMTKAELIKNLGTVAKSGTTAFLEGLGSGENNMSMIGQFGVGFYSAFLVANKVTVTSKSNDDEQHVWTSTADSKFFLTKDPRGDTLGRGTRVTLHLKDDSSEYVEQDKIKNLVKKYSEFINYPISLYVSHDERVEVPETYPEPESKLKMTTYDENGEEIMIENDDMEILSEDESEATTEDVEVKMKTITQQKWEWEILNEIKAIWLRPKGEITDREYKDFYRTISKDPEDPLAWTHFSAEGEIEFKAILYVPRTAPTDAFNEYYNKSSAIKLYVRRVLITEEFEDLMPRYLTFIRGVVDSDDLPLNVSRE